MKLNLPPYSHKVQKSGDKKAIYDIVRRKYVALTPEEWVRQHLLHYFIYHLAYPKSLLSVETGVVYNQLAKRSDVVVYGRNAEPLMVVECKSFRVALTDKVFEQSAIYNSTLKAPYLLISNGLDHFCCSLNLKTRSYRFLENIPTFGEMEG